MTNKIGTIIQVGINNNPINLQTSIRIFLQLKKIKKTKIITNNIKNIKYIKKSIIIYKIKCQNILQTNKQTNNIINNKMNNIKNNNNKMNNSNNKNSKNSNKI